MEQAEPKRDRDVIAKFAKLHKEQKRLKNKLSQIEKEISELEPDIQEIFLETNTQRLSSNGITLYVERKMRANIRFPEDEKESEKLRQAFHDAGMGASVKRTINANTLTAWVREIEEDNNAKTVEAVMKLIPKGIRDHINIAEVINIRGRLQ